MSKIIVNEKDPDVVAYRETVRKFQEIEIRRVAKEAELDAAVQKFLAARQEPKQSELEQEAEMLLSGIPSRIEAGKAEQLTKQVETLRHEVEVLIVATEKQREACDRARGKFSLAVCKANSLRYIAIEQRLAGAVQELGAANEAEEIFFDELVAAGVSSISFRPMRIQQVGTLRNEQSLATIHRREVKTYCPEAFQGEGGQNLGRSAMS
jgi:hypothetical protein